jgi:hypothetical protein
MDYAYIKLKRKVHRTFPMKRESMLSSEYVRCWLTRTASIVTNPVGSIPMLEIRHMDLASMISGS